MPLVWVLLAIATLTASPARAQGVASETLVMPFDNTLTDPKLFWLGEGSAVLLSETLERYGATTVPREARLSAFERLQLPPAAALSHATVIKVGQFVGASDVVVGGFALSGDHLTVRARSIRLEAGRLLPEVVEEGPLTDLVAIYDRTARRLRGATSAAPAARRGTLLTSPPALELFVKGLIAEQLPTKRSFLEQAAKSAPDDDRIKLALWQVHTDVGDHLRALDAIAKVSDDQHSFTPGALSVGALSLIDLKRYDEAFGTLKALNGEARSAEALNAMGVVQLRRGGNPQTGTAAQFFSQASQTDPSDPDYFFNLGYAHWIDKDPPAAIYWLREAVRREPDRRRCPLRAQRGAAARRRHGRSRARARAGPAVVLELRR